MNRKVVIKHIDGREQSYETTDNPFEIAWTAGIASVHFLVQLTLGMWVEVGSVYRTEEN